MIGKLASVFGSQTKAQEILFLLNDAKTVVRQGFYDLELPAVEEFCTQNQLYLIKSKFKVLITKNKIYSHKGIRIAANDTREGMYFIYISKDEKTALLAHYYELTGNDTELGFILGYPSCCVNFFCHNFSDQNPDLQLAPTNPWTNLTKRNQDCVLLSHFPCHSECAESIRLAQQYASLLQKNAPDLYREMMNLLQLPAR